jgi:hypothetical protein
MTQKKNKLNLDNLSREQKLQMLDMIEEKRRRLRLKQDVYKPNAGQIKVHNSTATLRFVASGNGAGKTALAVNEVLWAAHGYNPVTETFTPVPVRIIVLLDDPSKVADVWLPEIAKWYSLKPEQLHKRGKNYVSQITFDCGSEILFMFHAQEPMLFESLELDVLVADEPPPRHVYISLRRGGRKAKRRARYLIIGTPIAAAWLRTEIFEPWAKGELKDTECFRFGTKVNEKNLASGYIEEFSAVLSEKERRIRLHGEFFDLEGLALAHLFNQAVHVTELTEPWPTHNSVVVAIDPHPSKPHVAIMLGVDQDGYFYYLKELRLKMVAREFGRELKKWYEGYRVVDITCDSLGSSEGTGGEGFKSFIQILNEEGVRCRATTWDEKNDADFIARIQDVLKIPEQVNNFGDKLPKLRIVRGNTGIISDCENVSWMKYKNMDEYKQKLDIANKDYLACLKYALALNLTFNKSKSRIYKSSGSLESYGIKDKGKAPKILSMGYRKYYKR